MDVAEVVDVVASAEEVASEAPMAIGVAVVAVVFYSNPGPAVTAQDYCVLALQFHSIPRVLRKEILNL